MRVIVLTTGRSGSTTFHQACNNISNFTSGHETNSQKPASERVEFPENHIEADNRLSWLLGRLDDRYGNEAYYVWLKRDHRKVSKSYAKRWGKKIYILNGYFFSILQYNDWADVDRYGIASDYVETVNANIAMFLKDKTHKMVFRLENAEDDFRRFWEWIGAEGDIDKALAEWSIAYNVTSDGNRKRRLRRMAGKLVRVIRNLPDFLKDV